VTFTRVQTKASYHLAKEQFLKLHAVIDQRIVHQPDGSRIFPVYQPFT
jgi:hypothetical protein